jgi:hypothetical protein
MQQDVTKLDKNGLISEINAINNPFSRWMANDPIYKGILVIEFYRRLEDELIANNNNDITNNK